MGWWEIRNWSDFQTNIVMPIFEDLCCGINQQPQTRAQQLGRQMSLERQILVQDPVTNGHGVFYSVFVQYKTLLLFCCVKLEIIREID